MLVSLQTIEDEYNENIRLNYKWGVSRC
jgi:uncharacterized protein YsxB (DUF464 family)